MNSINKILVLLLERQNQNQNPSRHRHYPCLEEDVWGILVLKLTVGSFENRHMTTLLKEEVVRVRGIVCRLSVFANAF